MYTEVYILYVKVKPSENSWYEISWNEDGKRLEKLKKNLERYAKSQEFKIDRELRNLEEFKNA
mgnify:CR=1 FL=1